MKKGSGIIKGCIPCLAAIAIMYAGTLVVLYFLSLVCFFLGMEVEEVADERIWSNLGLIATGCVQVSYIIVFGKFYQKKKVVLNSAQDKKCLSRLDILWLTVVGIVLQFVVSMLLIYILPFFPDLNESYQELSKSLLSGNSILAFVVTGFLAPIGEEYIFRGASLLLLEQGFAFWKANIIQAFLFGLYHMNIVQFLYAFVIGMILGLIYKKYRNLLACIWVHAVINILANVISFIG